MMVDVGGWPGVAGQLFKCGGSVHSQLDVANATKPCLIEWTEEILGTARTTQQQLINLAPAPSQHTSTRSQTTLHTTDNSHSQIAMAPVKTRSSGRHSKHNGYKADPEDTNDDDDFYGMRELKHQLAGLNLQLKDTTGDGNCLFRACADQYTGSERDHAALRAEVCKYIADNVDHFESFMDNETVEAHVAQMRKNGTYGGNIELVAFARLKKVDIKVYQPGYIFVIEGVDVKKEGSTPGQRPVMHIA